MNIRRLAILMLAAVTLSACGPDRGLRVEQTGVTASRPEPGATSGSIRVKAAITVSSPPHTPTLEGHTIWAGVQFADRGQAIQAVDMDSAEGRGIVALPRSVQVGVALASTPNVIWMLTSEPPGTHSRLQRLGARVEPARSAALAMLPARVDSFALPEPVLSFPRSTTLLGTTNSAVWLLSYEGRSYTLWRCDVSTLRVARFELASEGIPAVAITPQRVFVVRTARRRHAVSIETRDVSGRVIAESPEITIAGQFISGPGLATQCVWRSDRRLGVPEWLGRRPASECGRIATAVFERPPPARQGHAGRWLCHGEHLRRPLPEHLGCHDEPDVSST